MDKRMTIKSNPAFTMLLCFLMVACSGKKQELTDELINIDVLKAFDNQKEVRLSEFIQEVEFIPLESTPNSWFRYAYNYFVGEKYVMVGDGEQAHMVLFDRHGKFIRTIGTKGQGPGELIEPRIATMDPGEQFVYVHDVGQSKLTKFSVEGAFINEVNIEKITPSRYTTGMQFINEHEFVLVNHRPYAPMDGFASLPVFDWNLDHVKDILPQANDENLRINVEPHAVLTVNPQRITFWEPHLDTLYTISPEGSAIPTHVVGFSKGGPDHEFVTTNMNPNLYAENSIVNILDAGHCFHILGRKSNRWFTAIYNQETKEIFEVVQKSTCDTSRYASLYGLENDLFGAGRIWLRNYATKIDRFTSLIDLASFSAYYDLDCIREKEVKFPELRNRFIELVRDSVDTYQNIIVLMRAK